MNVVYDHHGDHCYDAHGRLVCGWPEEHDQYDERPAVEQIKRTTRPEHKRYRQVLRRRP